MTLSEIIEGLVDVQESAPDTFLRRITKKIESAIWKKVLKFIDKADAKKGRFENNSDNKKLLIEIGEEIDDAYLDSGIKESLDDYLQEFDIVEKLTKEFYRKTLRQADQKDLTQLFRDTRIFKTNKADELTKGLLNKAVFQTNITDNLRDIIFEGIVLGGDVDDIKARLKSEILTDKDGSSKILRYVSQISSDAVTQYAGSLQDAIRAKYDLDGLSYLGSIIETSRCNCANLTCTKRHPKYHGKFDAYKLKDQKGFRFEDLDKIISIMKSDVVHDEKPKHKNSEGLNKAITPETFATYRGGYNCRHQVVYFRLTDSDKAENKEFSSIIEG